MENSSRLIVVSAKEVVSKSDHSFDKTGRMYVAFEIGLKLDDPAWNTRITIVKRLFSFPLPAFASAAAARAFLDPALAALFIRFPERRTHWRDGDHARPYPVAGLAGASEKIADFGATMVARSAAADASLEMLVMIQKMVPLIWPQDSRNLDRVAYGRAAELKAAREYFDGEAEEGSRVWVSAEQTASNSHRVSVAIELSHRIEEPSGGFVTPLATRRFSFPPAAFTSVAAAQEVIAPALAGLCVRSPSLGTFWREGNDTWSHPVPVGRCARAPSRATFWRNGDEEWSHPIANLTAASEKIAVLGASMGGGGEMRVMIQKVTVLPRPENTLHWGKDEWIQYYREVSETEDALFFEIVTTVYGGGDQKLTCSICIHDVEIGCHVATLPCTHTFHVDCIDAWVKKSRTCPYCRSAC